MLSSAKKDTLKEINLVVDESRGTVRNHRLEVAEEEKFINALVKLIDKEAPEFREKMGEIKSAFLEILKSEKAYIDAEERCAEDINDISARYDVIYRLGEESKAAQRKITDAKTKIEKLRKDLELDALKGGQKKFKIEADINRAIELKKQALAAAEDKLLEYIAAKEKYTTFKVNRLTHAYTQFGEALTASMRQQAEDVEKFSQIISEAQENIDHLLETETAPADTNIADDEE